jgi:anti-anti-sigma factor
MTIIRFNDVNLVEESEIALVKKEIHDHLGRRNLRVLLDFKNVRRMSSAAVEMLLDLYRWLRQQDGRLALCRVNPSLQDGILRTLNVIQPVPHFTDKKVALAGRW